MLEEEVVTADKSKLQQTVSHISADSALLDRQEVSFDVESERKKQRVSNIIRNIFVYTFLTICAVFAFMPFYWMIISSLKTEMEYREAVPTFFPRVFMWGNYKSVLMQTDSAGSFSRILLNTLIVGLLSTGIGVVVTIVTAYALARMNFKGKNILFGLMLATMMIPGEMYTLTNYLTISNGTGTILTRYLLFLSLSVCITLTCCVTTLCRFPTRCIGRRRWTACRIWAT